MKTAAARIAETIAQHPDWLDRPEHKAMLARMVRRHVCGAEQAKGGES